MAKKIGSEEDPVIAVITIHGEVYSFMDIFSNLKKFFAAGALFPIGHFCCCADSPNKMIKWLKSFFHYGHKPFYFRSLLNKHDFCQQNICNWFLPLTLFSFLFNLIILLLFSSFCEVHCVSF